MWVSGLMPCNTPSCGVPSVLHMPSEFTPLDTDAKADLTIPLFPPVLSRGVQPLARVAAEQLQSRLANDVALNQSESTSGTTEEGKMFGVLVVQKHGKLGYLCAFSGKWRGHWIVDGFVPPPFDVKDAARLLSKGDRELQQLGQRIQSITQSAEYKNLLTLKKELIGDFNGSVEHLKQEHQRRKQQRAEQRKQSTSEVTLELLARQSQSDKRQRKDLRKKHEIALGSCTNSLLVFDQQLQKLRSARTRLSQDLQSQYFSLFHLFSGNGCRLDLVDAVGGASVPAGTGECAAPKLLSFAYQHGFLPLAGAEFWWGASPRGEVRHHATFYPPCRSKCASLLPRMAACAVSKARHQDALEAVPAYQNTITNFHSTDLYPQQTHRATGVEVVYQDGVMAVVNKPSGLLSVPGKTDRASLAVWAAKKWPAATGPLLVHRLDMDTSGLVLIALEAAIHKQLQQQFMQRLVGKKYTALVKGWISQNTNETEGVICLPLRVDLEDRPRQMVCDQYGRVSESHWRLVGETKMADQRVSRLLLQPVTGRTHQLRVHMASQQGLGMPIVGDPLYAPINAEHSSPDTRPMRMMLHAERLEFTHPLSGENIQVTSPAPF